MTQGYFLLRRLVKVRGEMSLTVLARTLNRLLKKGVSCFDRLSTNGKSPTTSSLPPCALSLSKGERRAFQHPVKRLRCSLNCQRRLSQGDRHNEQGGEGEDRESPHR